MKERYLAMMERLTCADPTTKPERAPASMVGTSH
jgi:hypothetical protein